MSLKVGNLFCQLPSPGAEEVFETLLERPGVRLERIISHGHATPPGQWMQQTEDEWVVLLKGGAELRFVEGQRLSLAAGDHVFIPAGLKHRLESTRDGEDSIWLAVHMPAIAEGES